MAFVGLGAGIAGGLGSIGAAGISSAFQASANTKAFHRQKMIMKNRIQWQVKDLIAAGLNPILAAGGGLGGGGAAGVSNIGFPNIENPITAGISSALAARRNKEEVKLIKSQRHLTSQNVHTAAQLEMKHAADAKLTRTRNVLEQTGVSAAKSAEAMDKTQAGGVLRQVKRVMEAISPFKGATGIGRRPGGP